MPASFNILVKKREGHGEATWGLYLPDEDRWLALLFRTEREAIRFAKELRGKPDDPH